MVNGPILLVEDDPKDEALTRRALTKHGVANPIDIAHDGQEALDYLFGSGGAEVGGSRPLPAVVLLDLNLPKISGLDVLKRIRSEERTKRLPVVILTSSDEERDLDVGYELGCNSYVRKPVEFEEFAKAIGLVGAYWLVVNTPPPVVG